MRGLRNILFLLFIFSSPALKAVTNKIDSLEHALQRESIDTSKVKLLNQLSMAYATLESGKALDYAKKALDLALKCNFSRGKLSAYFNLGKINVDLNKSEDGLPYLVNALEIAREQNIKSDIAACYNVLGIAYAQKGNLEAGKEYFLNALKFYREMGNLLRVAACTGNIGSIYYNLGDYTKALEYYFETLKIDEKFKDISGLANTYEQIGGAYYRLSKIDMAKTYYEKALKYNMEVEDYYGIGSSYLFLGHIQSDKKNFEQAIAFYQKALDYFEKVNSENDMAYCYSSIGNVYEDMGENEKGIFYELKAHEIYKKFEDLPGLIVSCNNLGEVYSSVKQYARAIASFKESIEYNNTEKSIDDYSFSYSGLSRVYAAMGDYKNAYNYHCLHKRMSDSIFNSGNVQKQTQLEMNYEFEKIQLKKELEAKELEAQHKTVVKEQKLIRNFFIVGFTLLAIVAFQIFRSYKQKKAANKKLETYNAEIESQKQVIEEKNKEVFDSIYYARRIQRALLTSDALLRKNLPGHFVLYKPKDIVSGDFYWGVKIKSGQFMLAVADCTGHGVPGAFMSMLGISFLNEIIVEKDIQRPDLALNHLRDNIINALNAEGHEEESKDGMDICLCNFDFNEKKLQFASANNTLYLVRKTLGNDASPFELIEYKADKFPVGKFGEQMKPFTLNEIQLAGNDMLYLFTDGYADQFGGGTGKKLMKNNFKELLLNIQHLSLNEQEKYLSAYIEKWRGERKQIDDMLIVGIRVA
jgi:tetratricopeptide (TPR) repeat protein/serine phosphatase RsbU (regulator of sigma subunit)